LANDDQEEERPKPREVVDPDTVVDPRTMMIKSCNTFATNVAMLTAKRFLSLASDTKILFIKTFVLKDALRRNNWSHDISRICGIHFIKTKENCREKKDANKDPKYVSDRGNDGMIPSEGQI